MACAIVEAEIGTGSRTALLAHQLVQADTGPAGLTPRMLEALATSSGSSR